MLVQLIVILLLLFFMHVGFNYNRTARLMRKVPGPKMAFIFGNVFDIIIPRAELFEFLKKVGNNCGTIWRLWSYPLGAVFLSHPDDIQTILSGATPNKKNIFYKFLKPWLQEGLLVSEGEKWQKRRKILTPAFHFNILRRFCTTFEENSAHFAKTLEETQEMPVNVVEAVSEFTLHTICETAMGTQINKDVSAKSYKNAIYGLGDVLVHRISRTFLYLDFIFYLSAAGRLEKKYLNIVHKFTIKVINFRKRFIDTHETGDKGSIECNDTDVDSIKWKPALLDLLISEERNGKIDITGVQEEVDTFMFEGHDTTACGLTYLLLELANNKPIQDKIVDELKEIFGDSKRATSVDDLANMRYLERCIKESLRLYPPVPIIGRILCEEAKLGGYIIPSGIYVLVNIFALHRSEDIYKDPEIFNPDRFLPENSANRHPYAYIPFSAGPRNCIGQKFAILEMKSLVSKILRKYILVPNTKIEDLQFTADLVLRTTAPIYVTFTKRLDSF